MENTQIATSSRYLDQDHDVDDVGKNVLLEGDAVQVHGVVGFLKLLHPLFATRAFQAAPLDV